MNLGIGCGIFVCAGPVTVAAPATLYTADFTTLTPGVVSLASFSGLNFSRASTATVQTSASALVSGLANDAARYGRVFHAADGLLIEPASTNILIQGRHYGSALTPWDAGGSTVVSANGYAGPDGTATIADEVSCLVNTRASQALITGAVNAGTYTCSSWVRTSSGTAVVNGFVNSTVPVATTLTATTAWKRFAITNTIPATSLGYIPMTGFDYSAYGGAVAGARQYILDCHVAELGKFATSTVITTGSADTRAGERLWHATPASLISGGSLRLEYRMRPHSAFANYPANMYLFYKDVSNYAYITASTGIINVTINGSSYTTSSGITWAADDDLQIWLAAGGGSSNTVVKYRTNSGGAITLGTSGAAQATIATTGTIDLLCNGTSGQLACALQRLDAWPTTGTPTWAV